ncbi:unnamed protein product [Zymoseptoria tritici ST99CH_3D1]|nr:unnamed protein product [Zymoseptoria tritici ST99CH_3D1]
MNDDRVVLEARPCTPTNDIIVLESGRGRLRSTLNERGQAPPEICKCPVNHAELSARGGTHPRNTTDRAAPVRKPISTTTAGIKGTLTQSAPSDQTKPTDAKDIMSKTCDICHKVKPPPSGRKLGLRMQGSQKVIKYIPLNADAGFNTTNREGDDDDAANAAELGESPSDAEEDEDAAAATLEAAESTALEDQDDDNDESIQPEYPEATEEASSNVEDAAGGGDVDANQEAIVTEHEHSTAMRDDMLPTPFDEQGETSVTGQQPPAATQDDVLPTPFDDQGETSVTAREQSAVTQDVTTPTPDNAQSAGPETADAPGPRAVSSPPDLRKRAGDCSLEEPPAKRLSVTSSSTARDEDDEEVDPPKPVIKAEESDIITIEDDSDDQMKHSAKNIGSRSNRKKIRLQNELQRMEIEDQRMAIKEKRLQIAGDKLRVKHELEALERSEAVKRETPIKIED